MYNYDFSNNKTVCTTKGQYGHTNKFRNIYIPNSWGNEIKGTYVMNFRLFEFVVMSMQSFYNYEDLLCLCKISFHIFNNTYKRNAVGNINPYQLLPM